jgi:diadenosine tetraphosphate (Ap4A) HIT family hydrolase
VTGFNIGTNSGVSAGQTVLQAHIHLIPRRDGDCVNPRGGVRGVIDGKRNY